MRQLAAVCIEIGADRPFRNAGGHHDRRGCFNVLPAWATVPTISREEDVDGSDLLTALYHFEAKQLWDLGFKLAVATASLVAVYFTFALLWARFRKSRSMLQRRVWIRVLLLSLGAEAVLLYFHNPIGSREQFVFIPMPNENSFATLAIFTELPNKLHRDQNGILHVYARAYYSPNPEDIVAVHGSVDSHWLGLSKVVQHEVRNAIYGKTRGTDLTYEYQPDSLGVHALREQFAIDIKHSKTRKHTYTVDVVEMINVVKPFPLSEMLTNSSVLEVFLPLLIAAFGLSVKSKIELPEPAGKVSS